VSRWVPESMMAAWLVASRARDAERLRRCGVAGAVRRIGPTPGTGPAGRQGADDVVIEGGKFQPLWTSPRRRDIKSLTIGSKARAHADLHNARHGQILIVKGRRDRGPQPGC